MRRIPLLIRTHAKALITAATDTYDSRALTLGGDDFPKCNNIFMYQSFENLDFADSSDWEAIFFLFRIDSFKCNNLTRLFMSTDKNTPKS